MKLATLFDTEADKFEQCQIDMYGKSTVVRYLCRDYLWGKKLYRKMRFVLVEFDDGRRAIIACTDTSMDPLDIVKLYCKRFSIECTFKSMKHDVAAFSNRFWSIFMPKLNRYAKSGEADRATNIKGEHQRKCVLKSLHATEGYVFCGVVATGLLQMLSLMHVDKEVKSKLRYLRTPSKTAESEATVAEYLQRNIFRLLTLEAELPISQILLEKMEDLDDDFPLEKAG